MEMLKVENVTKTFASRSGAAPVQALRGVSFVLEQGEYAAVMGESGSGKTTLLNILSALDRPTSGKVTLDGTALDAVRDRELAAFRRDNLGFVFQEYNLLDTLSLRDNILLPLVLGGTDREKMKHRLEEIAGKLGLSGLLDRFPCEVSGGQKQRAAAARALITHPRLLLADEPTGALDSGSSEDLLKVFSAANRDGQTILTVTHSVDAASHADRVFFIRDGRIFHELRRGQKSNAELYADISRTLTLLRTGGEEK